MQKMLMLALLLFSNLCISSSKPDLLLAGTYHPAITLSDYYVSEKLDGIRAFWDGQQLTTRGGQTIHAPLWFTEHFPQTHLDGELWIARGEFEQVSSTVRSYPPDEKRWRSVRYYIFELPYGSGSFSERLQTLKSLIDKQNSPYLRLIPQQMLSDHQQLMGLLEAVTKAGGEGLMLHRKEALYRTGRNGDLLKLKPYFDDEATVIGYKAGQGQLKGKTGALLVENKQGKRFAIGSGLNDALRENPPAIGSHITYQYDGLTKNGLPRHARFLRIYHEAIIEQAD